MQDHITSALYDSYDDAVRAVRELEAAGLTATNISLVSVSGDERWHEDKIDRTADGAATGAAFGTVLGGSAGLLAGLGLLAVPGFGPVVAGGWLVATLASAGLGASAGGLIGALAGSGVSSTDADAYAEGVRRGGTLLSVRTGDVLAERVAEILKAHGPVDLSARQQGWRQDGWGRTEIPESEAQPLTATDVLPRETSFGQNGRDCVADGRLQVSMRESDHDRICLRSYILEIPGERAKRIVDGAAIDDPLTDQEWQHRSRDLFRDWTFDVIEHAEVPLVSKEIKLVEAVIHPKTDSSSAAAERERSQTS